MSGIKYQTPDDIARLGTRIKQIDEPRFERFLAVRKYVVDRLKGGYFDQEKLDFKRGVATNDVLEFASNLETDLAFQLPEAEVYTAKSGAAYAAARGAHHAFNQWMQETRFELVNRRAAIDYIVGYAVFASGLAPKGPKEDEIDWPWSEVVPVSRYGWDTSATCHDEKDYAYQLHEDYHHDLIERAKADNADLTPGAPGWWDIELLEKLQNEPAGLSVPDMLRGARQPSQGKIGWYSIYLPKADASEQLSDGEKARADLYHGVQVTVIADAGNQRKPGFVEIRKPLPVFHAEQGPYTLIGMQQIPDETIPASVLILTIGQSIEYNSIVAANNQAARKWKNMLFVDDRRLAQLIESGKHDTVYYKAALSKDSIVPAQVGGLTAQQLTQEERAEKIYYRSVGLTDAQRGASEGGITATQDAIVAGEATKRRDGQVNTYHLGVEQHLYGVLYLLYNTDTVIVEQGPEAVDEFKAPAPVFFGGKHDPDQVLRYFAKHHPEVQLSRADIADAPEVPLSDLQLRVRLQSMGRKTKIERIMETTGELQFLMLFFQMLVSSPFVPVATAKRWAAKRSGIVEIPDLVDDAWVELMRGLMIQAQVPPAESSEPDATMGRAGPRTVDMPMSGGKKRAVQAKPQNMQLGPGPSSQEVRTPQPAGMGGYTA